MEDKKERSMDESKIAKYVRWIVVTVIGLLIVFTVIMAIYRKIELRGVDIGDLYLVVRSRVLEIMMLNHLKRERKNKWKTR